MPLHCVASPLVQAYNENDIACARRLSSKLSLGDYSSPAYDNSFTEVMIGPEGADTMVELRGEWKDRIKIEAAMAEAVATPQNWELATGEEVVVHVELNAARFGSELRDVAAIGFAAEEAKVKSMIEALGGEAAYVGMRHWGAVGQGGQVRERQDAR